MPWSSAANAMAGNSDAKYCGDDREEYVLFIPEGIAAPHGLTTPMRDQPESGTSLTASYIFIENDRFREDHSERHQLPRMKTLRFSKTSRETIFSKMTSL